VLALPAAGLSPRLDAEEPNWAELYQRCVKSVAYLATPVKDQEYTERSGTLIDVEQRLVLTSFRVGLGANRETVDTVYAHFPMYGDDGKLVTNKEKYRERVKAGKALKGKVLFRDEARDLALVQLDELPLDTLALPLAEKSIEVSAKAHSIFSPGGLDAVFVSNENRVRSVAVKEFSRPAGRTEKPAPVKCKMVMATDPVDRRDSGGPMIDRWGRLVAVSP
jgi:S1-C subfamily serine protease